MLIKFQKQVVVVYTKGHLGKEIWQLKRGIFNGRKVISWFC